MVQQQLSVPAAILKLTRWREFVPFTTILTWLGGLVAYELHEVELDWRLLVVLVANLGAVAYAFMVNDIEDAEDDAHEAGRASRNPITSGQLSKQTGWLAAFGVALVSAVCYALLGTTVFIIGLVTIVLAHLYSWKPVRLKARPLVDIISHALMLSTLLFLAPYFIYRDHLGMMWVLAVGTFLISANGQFYNQVRDYEADQAAGLHNTASVLGKTATNLLAQFSVAGFVASLVAAALMGAFPLWLGPVFLVVVVVVMLVMRNNHTDMRGTETDDLVGQLQVQFLTIFNITLLVWLAAAYLS